ncbi:hypothetical protein HOD75_04705 [archaeon]|jgi:hypothetical protein|nr:hypothetical protein [archaeon]MBT4242165.1 hypothetical protein [archaeon]MBT4417853.1 hypothetical protein [archaeon]
MKRLYLSQQPDERYEPCSSQGFGTFEEAERLIFDYCNFCTESEFIEPESQRPKHKCDTLNRLRLAMGENYPSWDEAFVKLQRKDALSIFPDTSEELPYSLVICKKFKSPQLEFAFMTE